jgi:hypothetical protein
MRVGWKRGLLRLWIVASICWIAGTAYFKYDDLTYAISNNDICEKLERENAHDGYQRYDIGQCRTLDAEQRTRAIKSASERIFMPPIIALLVGLSVWWALKGFRLPQSN